MYLYIYKYPIYCCFLWQFTVSFKNAFSGLFFCKQKGTRVSQWQEDIKVVVSLPFHLYKTMSQFFEILILSWNFWLNIHHVHEINLIFILQSKDSWRRYQNKHFPKYSLLFYCVLWWALNSTIQKENFVATNFMEISKDNK